MKKNIVVALSVAALLFAQVPTAHAVNFQDIKKFFIGPGADNTEEVEEGNEEMIDRSNLVGAAVLANLSPAHSVSILPTAEVGGEGEVEEMQSNTATFSFEIQEGDNLWNRIEAELEASFPEITEDQENYTIDRIIDEVRSLDTSTIADVGISSGNPDLIYPEETISFSVNVTGEGTGDIEIDIN
ncbi:MAG: hypothetical protein WDZ70_00205 [Candidatus Paceibacterota bacterium]